VSAFLLKEKNRTEKNSFPTSIYIYECVTRILFHS